MIKDTFTHKSANVCQETIVDILREEAALAGSESHKCTPLPVYVDSFFDVVLDNWSALGNYTYTFRALADIVEMGVGWPDDQVSRTELECCLSEIIEALDE